MEKLHQVFEKGHIQGDLCIDISFGSFMHHLLSCIDCFKEILLIRATGSCIFEINRWLHDRTGAFCWKHISSFVTEKKGMSDSCDHIEMQLKNKIKHVIMCDLKRENITDPVETPQGDCLITIVFLECVSNDHNEYGRNLKNLLKCLKPGGTFILFGSLNATYYTINGVKFHMLKCDKEFICSALLGENLIIERCEVFPRTAKSDLSDFEGVLFILARNGK
ncbi:nicotinamide N-methyltransferase-like [Gastrophryne carolinensis]